MAITGFVFMAFGRQSPVRKTKYARMSIPEEGEEGSRITQALKAPPDGDPSPFGLVAITVPKQKIREKRW